MKKTRLLVPALLLTGALAMSSCSPETKKSADATVENAGEDIKRNTNEMSADWETERDKMRNDLNEGVDKLDRKIEEADAEIKNATAEEKVRWEKRKVELRAERDELKQSLSELGERTKENWNNFRSDVNERMDKIKADLKN